VDCEASGGGVAWKWQLNLKPHVITPAATGICASTDIILTTAVRDLGVYIDAELSMRSRVQRTVAGCFAILRQLRSNRRSAFFRTLVVALWLSPLC